MNTDNMAVSGETIDYGPCAFLDAYDPNKVFSSIDEFGAMRSATSRASPCGISPDSRRLCCPHRYQSRSGGGTGRSGADDVHAPLRCGPPVPHAGEAGSFDGDPEDAGLIEDLLSAMHEMQADFTLTFRALSNLPVDGAPVALIGAFAEGPLRDWSARYAARVTLDPRPAERCGGRRWKRPIRASFRATTASKRSSAPPSATATMCRSMTWSPSLPRLCGAAGQGGLCGTARAGRRGAADLLRHVRGRRPLGGFPQQASVAFTRSGSSATGWGADWRAQAGRHTGRPMTCRHRMSGAERCSAPASADPPADR